MSSNLGSYSYTEALYSNLYPFLVAYPPCQEQVPLPTEPEYLPSAQIEPPVLRTVLVYQPRKVIPETTLLRCRLWGFQLNCLLH